MVKSGGLFSGKKKPDGPVTAKAEAPKAESKTKSKTVDLAEKAPACSACARSLTPRKGVPCQMGLTRGDDAGCASFWPMPVQPQNGE